MKPTLGSICTKPGRPLAIATLVVAFLGLVSVPAQASDTRPGGSRAGVQSPAVNGPTSVRPAVTGNGCKNSADGEVGVCVSYSSYYHRVSGDWYLNNWSGDGCYAYFTLYASFEGKGHTTGQGSYYDHLGRYGELHIYSGSSSGLAYSFLQVYDCYGNQLFTAFSPTMSFP